MESKSAPTGVQYTMAESEKENLENEMQTQLTDEERLHPCDPVNQQILEQVGVKLRFKAFAS